MAIQVQLTDKVLQALQQSPVFEIQGLYGNYVAVQNPWKEPVTLTHNGMTLATLSSADDWLAAPDKFYGIPQIYTFSTSEWDSRAKAFDPAGVNWNAVSPQNSYETAQAPSSPYSQVTKTPLSYQYEYNRQFGAGEGGVVLGIAGIIGAFFFPIVGLVLSIIGLRRASKDPAQKGKVLNIIGIIASSVVMMFYALFFIGIFTSLNNYGSGSYSSEYTPNEEIPAYWAGANEKIYGIASSHHDDLDSGNDAKVCSYGGISSHYYSSDVPTTEEGRKELAAMYLDELKEAFPGQPVSYEERTRNASYASFTVTIATDYRLDEKERTGPSVDVMIEDDYASISVYTDCL